MNEKTIKYIERLEKITLRNCHRNENASCDGCRYDFLPEFAEDTRCILGCIIAWIIDKNDRERGGNKNESL